MTFSRLPSLCQKGAETNSDVSSRVGLCHGFSKRGMFQGSDHRTLTWRALGLAEPEAMQFSRVSLSKVYNSWLVPEILRLAPGPRFCLALNDWLIIPLPLVLLGWLRARSARVSESGATQCLLRFVPSHSRWPNPLQPSDREDPVRVPRPMPGSGSPVFRSPGDQSHT